MKLIIDATDQSDSSKLGAGRVYIGKTGRGVPVEVLVSGIRPALGHEKAFEREYDALPELTVLDPVDEEIETRIARVDIYLVIATWVCAVGEDKAEVSPKDIAQYLRENLEKQDKDRHDGMRRAAKAVCRLIADALHDAPPVSHEVGHA